MPELVVILNILYYTSVCICICVCLVRLFYYFSCILVYLACKIHTCAHLYRLWTICLTVILRSTDVYVETFITQLKPSMFNCLDLRFSGGVKCCDESSLFVFVCLCARISQKPHGWTSPFFVHVALTVVLRRRCQLRYVKCFRFCGWHHVFAQWALVRRVQCRAARA